MHFDVTSPLLLVYGTTENLFPAALEPAQLQGRSAPFEAAPLDHPVEGQLEVLLTGTRRIDRLRDISKVILDDLFSAFGWPGCHLIDNDGFLQWPGQLRRLAEKWNEEQRRASESA
ncbi:MAG: hypothetical protein ACRDWS_07005 [Acidimicrobiia bacterium]